MNRIPLKKVVTSTSTSTSTSSSSSSSAAAAAAAASGTGADLPELNTFGRRSFLKGLSMVGLASLPLAGSLLGPAAKAQAVTGPLSKGDAAILRFLGAIEILESDIWEQYWELGGTQDNEFAPMTGGNDVYTAALTILDGDMPQYIHDNTDDEFSHAAFLKAYLASRGASVTELDLLDGPRFRTLQGSTAKGSSQKGRLTNLTQLTVDTSFWSRYRSDANNPDLDPGFTFPQAVKGLNVGQHTAIPRSNNDTAGSQVAFNPDGSLDQSKLTNHLKAIAFTAGFHFAWIEQGGTSLYPSLAQRVTDLEVLRVLLSIGPTETMHFQTWQDKAGNATPLTDTDPITHATVTFVDLTQNQPESLQANLIMPEPCPFLSRKLPICSIIRPTNTQGAATGAVKAFAADGLFIHQSKEFIELLTDLATDADAARRGGY